MKRYIKHVLAVILMGIMCVGMAGCSKETEKEHVTIDTDQNKWDNETLDENLQANFEADTSKISNAFFYECTMSAIPIEEIKNTFFQNDSSETEITKRLYEEDLPEVGYLYYLTSENGLDISSSCMGAKAKTAEADFYRNFLACDTDAWDLNARPSNLGTGEELENLDKGQIQEAIVDGLSKLLPNVNVAELKFYSLTADYLNEIQNKELARLENGEDSSWYEKEKSMAKEWQDEESAYYITVEMALDQILINDALTQGFADGKTITGYTATFIYNSEGCVYAELPGSWEVQDKQEQKILTVAEALEVLKNDMSSVILTNENIIEDAKLKYSVMRTFSSAELEIQPIWIFKNKLTIEGQNSEGETISEVYEENFYVDAITGEVLH